MSAVRGGPRRSVLYVRLDPDLIARVRARAAAHERTLSDEAGRVMGHGLACDETALHALIGWAWRMQGYLDGRGDPNAEPFAEAIRRAEVGLGLRREG